MCKLKCQICLEEIEVGQRYYISNNLITCGEIECVETARETKLKTVPYIECEVCGKEIGSGEDYWETSDGYFICSEDCKEVFFNEESFRND